jgi:hypothetical protein
MNHELPEPWGRFGMEFNWNCDAHFPLNACFLIIFIFAICCILLYSTILQPSTQQILNKQIHITVLICLFVHLLHVSIQLDHHQVNIHEMYTRIELYY